MTNKFKRKSDSNVEYNAHIQYEWKKNSNFSRTKQRMLDEEEEEKIHSIAFFAEILPTIIVLQNKSVPTSSFWMHFLSILPIKFKNKTIRS